MSEFQAKIVACLNELIVTGDRFATEGPFDRSGSIADRIGLCEWRASCENLLERIVGKPSAFFKRFRKTEAFPQHHHWTVSVQHATAVLRAVKKAIDDGLLFDTQLLAAADVFDDLLERAGHLLENGYKDAAAMLTGAVLEATLRKLCDKHRVAFGARDTIEPLNQKLAKATVYNKLVQKQVTAWADIRNNADHGHFDKYEADNVRQMHEWVRGFAGQHLC